MVGYIKGVNPYSDFQRGISSLFYLKDIFNLFFARYKAITYCSVRAGIRGWEIPARGWVFSEIQPIARCPILGQ